MLTFDPQMTYHGQPCLQYFTAVIKNIASPSLEIKKLVYIYLVHHAEAEPDTALLSINTIQKSLSDGNAQVRALALRVMSAIRVPVISQIVALGIKRGVADLSPRVRKTAALAIPKCYRLDPATLPQLLDHLMVLLGDRQYYVAGAAVAALLGIAPQRLDLVHPHYRSLARMIVDMDEWGQLATLQLMLIYARTSFPRKTSQVSKPGTHGPKAKNLSDDAILEFEESEKNNSDNEQEKGPDNTILESDLELLLSSIKPLLRSRNSAVIMAVAHSYYYLGLQEHVESTIGPLISLLRAPQDIHSIALYYIVQICISYPKLFTQHATHFLVRSTDTPTIYQLKLELHTLIYPHAKPSLKGLILSELEHFSRGHDRALVHESVRAIGRCAQADVDTSQRCMSLLLRQISSPDGNLVAEALQVVRQLILRDPRTHQDTVIRLAKSLDAATNAQARACIIWLVGEFAGIEPQNNIAADVLRILAKGFADEPEAAKLQIILLAAKVYAHHLNSTKEEDETTNDESHDRKELELHKEPVNTGIQQSNLENQPQHPITQLWNYIMLLARYDTSYDLRDRARLYKALLALPSSTELASLMLLAPKPVPQTPSPSESRRTYKLGSATLVIGDESGGRLQGYEEIPDWVEAGQEPDPRLREVGNEKARSSAGGAAGTVTSISSDDKRGERGVMVMGGALSASDMLDNAIRDKASRAGSSTAAAAAAAAAAATTRKGIAQARSSNDAKEKTLDDWLDEEDDDTAVKAGDTNDNAGLNDNDDNESDDDEYTDASETETESGSGSGDEEEEEEEGSTEDESDEESKTENEQEKKGLIS